MILSSDTILQIIDILSTHGLLRTNKIIGDWYSCYCPIHSDGNEHRSSFGILLKDITKNGQKYNAGFCHCFACQLNMSLSKLVIQLIHTHSLDESVINTLLSLIDKSSEDTDSIIDSDTLTTVSNKFAVDYIKSQTGYKQPSYVSETELSSYRNVVPYMYERGLTDELIERYDIGVDMNFIPPKRKHKIPCITFPVRDYEGNTLFIARRSIKGKMFFLPYDIVKPVYGIYELPKNTKSMVITESVFNCITSVKYGKPAVALFGTGTPYQINQLKMLGVNEFILGLDPDESGIRGTNKLYKALRKSAIVWKFDGIPDGKDINDLSESQFNSLDII